MFGLGVAFNDVPVYQQAQGFFAGGTNLFASQTSYDTHSFRSKKLLTQAVASTLGITNNVATTNPPGTVVLKDGTLGYGAHNTVRQSGDLSQAVWTKRGTATAAAGAARGNGVTMSLISVGAAGVNDIYAFTSNLAVATDARCEPVFYIEPVSTSGTLQISNVNNSGKGNWSINLALISGPTLINRYHAAVTVTNEWKSTDGTGAGSGPNIYAASGTLSVYIAAQISNGAVPLDYVPTTSAAVYGPRFTHDNTNSTYFGLYGVYPQAGLLREVARTNVATRSEEFDHATYTKAGATTVTANAAIAPNGTTTADKIIPGANGSSTAISRSDGLQGSGKTMSVYLKAGEITVVKGQDGAGQEWTADLATGVLSGVSAVWASPKLKPVGAGWFRLCLTNAGAAAGEFYLGSSAGAGGSNGFYIWGLQIETGTFETSYIGPVISAAVARDADLIRPPTTYVSAAGPQTTMMGIVAQDASTSQQLLAADTNGRVAYILGGNIQMYDGANAAVSSGGVVAGVPVQLATRYGSSAMGVSVNGAAVVTATFDGSMGPGGSAGLGDNASGGNGFTGLITRIAIAPKVATDTQLQQLSAGLL